MNVLGQICLLAAFVGSGYAAFACMVGWHRKHPAVGRSGRAAASASVLALTAATAILVWALVTQDLRFAYVAQYSSAELPWHYAASALWVGQAGSLLLWAWLLGALAMAYRHWPRREASPLREPAFAVLMAYLCFLLATMIFAADPMEPSIATPARGAGLNPLLQHPAMLIHPPVVFLGYAAWAVPLAVAVIALASGRLDTHWIREARSWALFAWCVLGAGIILGGQWAYEELGWGGYWAWDPVENGSLMPWLTGTALIHTMMAWKHRGILKKTTMSLAVATFALCNLATFLTRSGVFSSVHAFSASAIGWMFLGLMILLVAGGGVLVFRGRKQLQSENAISGIWSREAFVLTAVGALLLLASVTLIGTLAVPLSDVLLGRKIVVGAAFYDNVLIPTGLILLGTTAAAPLLRWGTSPSPAQRRTLGISAGAAAGAAVLAFALGVGHPIEIAVIGSAAAAAAAFLGTLVLDTRRRPDEALWRVLPGVLRSRRRQYAGFLMHMGFVCLALGVAGSSLGGRCRELVMREGETVDWAGRSIYFARVIQRELPDKLVAEAELTVSRNGTVAATLLPAQHLHLLQEQWTTEVAIHSTWAEDLYVILHGSEGPGKVFLTFFINPMVRWIWLGGWLFAAGTLLALWPSRRRSAPHAVVPAPKHLRRQQAKCAS